MDRLGEAVDSFVPVLDQVSFVVFGFVVRFWLGLGVRIQIRVRVAFIGIFLGFLRHIFNMAIRGPLHKVKSIVMSCYTDDGMGGLALGGSSRHILPEPWGFPTTVSLNTSSGSH